jgi:hypothetical protein
VASDVIERPRRDRLVDLEPLPYHADIMESVRDIVQPIAERGLEVRLSLRAMSRIGHPSPWAGFLLFHHQRIGSSVLFVEALE